MEGIIQGPLGREQVPTQICMETLRGPAFTVLRPQRDLDLGSHCVLELSCSMALSKPTRLSQSPLHPFTPTLHSALSSRDSGIKEPCELAWQKQGWAGVMHTHSRASVSSDPTCATRATMQGWVGFALSKDSCPREQGGRHSVLLSPSSGPWAPTPKNISSSISSRKKSTCTSGCLLLGAGLLAELRFLNVP